MFKRLLVIGFAGSLSGQVQDTIIKFYPTDMERRDILDNEVEEGDVKGKAHFRSTYSGQGKLLNVEYVPGRRKASPKLSGLKLYYGYWDIENRDLAEGLTKDQLDGRTYYEVVFNKKGRIKSVNFYDKKKVRIWSHELIWNKAGTRSLYKVLFHRREPLTVYDEFLFADALSEMRMGWAAHIREREDHRPQSVTVKDELGQVYYYYTLQYMDGKQKSRTREVIISEYFRDDSTKVGMHKLFYNRKEYLHKAEYYDDNDNLKITHSYDYSNAPREIVLTITDERRKLLERRIIPFSNKYKRRLGPPKDKTGLADIIEFIENTGEENLSQLTQLVEAQFGITVETEQPLNTGDVKTNVTEDIKKQILANETTQEKKSIPTRAEKFVLGMQLGNKLTSGAYLADDYVLELGLDIQFPFTFDLFWFSLTPALSYGQVMFHGDDNSTVSWITLRSKDMIPINFPIIMEGAIGTVGPGFGIKGGLKTVFSVGVDLTLGTSAVIANDIDGNGNMTGYISGELGVSYTLPF